MSRTVATLGLALTFALGCSNLTGSGEPPPPPEPTDEVVPTDVEGTDEATEAGGDCCCAYTEDGSDATQHAFMALSNCEAWGFTCVEDATCEAAAAAPAPAPTPVPETPAPATTTTTPSPRPSPGPTVMKRPGTSTEPTTTVPKPGTMTRPGTTTTTEPEPSTAPAPSGTMKRPGR